MSDEQHDLEAREDAGILQGKRLAFVGRLASMPKRQAMQLVKGHGAEVLDAPNASCHWIVVGEEEIPLPDGGELEELFDEPIRAAVEAGTLEVIPETQLWQRLGLVDPQQEVQRLYTPAMLAELLKVSVAVIRRWHRRGLIVPAKEVRRLPYFDFQEIATARRLAEMLASGMSPAAIEKKLASLARFMPGVDRPLAQLSVIVEGRQILLRQGDGLVEPGGQLRFDFEAAGQQTTADEQAAASPPSTLPMPEAAAPSLTAEEMADAAADLEEEGHLEEAAEMLRASMAAGRPRPELCFQLAELLYRLGDLGGARERYYMAVELDEDYVEARANLGCVLAEQGQRELALAAFQGALAYHHDYADAHYHLARLLDELGRPQEAENHWRAFLSLAPDSPWAEQAQSRLGRG